MRKDNDAINDIDEVVDHECVCRRKRSTRIMWAKRPLLAPNTPASAIIHIHLATRVRTLIQ